MNRQDRRLCQQFSTFYSQNSYKNQRPQGLRNTRRVRGIPTTPFHPPTFLVLHISSFPLFNFFYPFIHISMWDTGSSTRFAFQGVTVIQEPVLLGYRDQARKIALYRQTERPLSPKPSLFARVWIKEANDLMASDGNRNIAAGVSLTMAQLPYLLAHPLTMLFSSLVLVLSTCFSWG